MAAAQKNINLQKLTISVLTCEAVGVLGYFATSGALTSWYANIIKPSFTPPAWVFGPVWTILYFLMGISLYLVWAKKSQLRWFWIQLTLNALWPISFFELHSPLLGLINIVALWISVVMTIRVFNKTSKPATYLLLPYLAWISFALILNFNIWQLN